MTLAEVLGELRDREIVLACEGDELLVRSMKRALDPALVAALRANKAALLELVRSGGYAAAVAAPPAAPLLELTEAEHEAIAAEVPGGAANVQDVYPLAPLQEGILFHHLMTEEGDPYLLGSLHSFGSRDELDRYLAALQAVMDRHDILRTAVRWEGLPEPVQVVWRTARLAVEEVELDHAGGDAAGQLYARFDPRHHRMDLRQAPLIRAHVAPDAAGNRWLLLLLRHHLISDHTTLEVLQAEIQAHLSGRAHTLPAPLPFRDFVARARNGVSAAEHRAFFTEMLGDVDEPTAPFGLLDARGDASAMREARLEVDARLSVRLRERARALGVSAASVFHVAWGQVLARASGRDDVVFGTLLLGRMQGGEGTSRVMGPFINTLPLRVRLGSVGAEASVRRTHALLAGLLRHEHASLALAQRCSRVEAPSPLFTTLLNYRSGGQKAGSHAADAPAGGMRILHAEERSSYPLALAVDDLGEGFRLKGQVMDASLDPARICRFVHRALEGLVQALETAPSRAVGAIDVLPAEERARVLDEWNRTDAAYPADACIHALFEDRVRATPHAVAVACEGEHLTYAELNARANRLAHHLRALGVGPDARVALAMARSPALVVAELAVLKAGGAYLPLDPEHPIDRLRAMLDDAAPVALLTTDALVERFVGLSIPVLVVDGAAPAWASAPETNPAAAGVTAESLAYVMYTSGSTGRPKGVMIPHRAVTQLVLSNGFVALGAEDRVALAANPAFDASTMEVWGPLLAGGRVVVVPRATLLDPAAYGALLRDQGVTALLITPALFEHYARVIPGALAGVRHVLTGGDRTDPAAYGRVLAAGGPATVYNCYGPTETTTFSIAHPVRGVPEGARTLPIGRPKANTRAYVLDGAGRPAPVDVAGELWVAGDGVARGYLGHPALTAERFVPDPFGRQPGARLYRTGDLCRWTAEGTLEFAGRTDHQAKIRGFRIEPGEIEARLRAHPGVREAVVLVRQDTPGDKRLVAYVVADEAAGADALQAHLAASLPAYMVPAAYVRLERLPLNANGKVDRKALPAPEDGARACHGYEAPVGETERALAEIWAGVLGVERVGRGDDFFALGGHSLLAVRIISRVRQVLAVEVALGELFARPVLADFARALRTAVRSELPSIQAAPRDGPLPLSFAQQRLWFLEQLGNLGGTYHMRAPLRLRGALDRAALARALDGIVARHEALRTTFTEVDGDPVQRIAPADAGFRLVEHDLAGRADADAELRRLMTEEAGTPFDLGHGPLIRGSLIHLAADDHVLLLAMHHIVSDGWSIGVLLDELSVLYTAHRQGTPAPLAALPVQYADYAVWQRRWVEGDVLRQQADYWAGTLAGAPELLELPTDHPRPAQMEHAGARLPVELDETLADGLNALSRRHGTTLFMTVLAGWAVVLGRLSGQDDVVIGTPTANRGRREIEGLIGFFVNTLALRVELSGAPTVAELLGRVRERALAAQHHQDIPFERVVERVDPVRSLSHGPLFQVMFAWQNAPGGSLRLPGVALGRMDAPDERVTAKEDLSLVLGEANGRIAGSVTYATSLFQRETVERWTGYLRRVLEEMVADEHRPVERLALMPEHERALIVQSWSRADASDLRTSSVHELFAAQASRTPGATAVVFDGGELTYAELNARANQLAHHLVRQGVGPDVRVGLCLDPGAEMMVAVLAVLKAGGGYVPLDPAHPADRLAYTLADSAPAVLLAQASLAERFAGADVPVIRVDADAAAWAHEPETDPARGGARPEHLAYVIYTSGSTGRPKGVRVEHGALAATTAAAERAFGFGPADRSPSLASVAFDIWIFEALLPLLSGASVRLFPRDRVLDVPRLVRELDGCTVLHAVPALMRGIVREVRETGEGALPGLRHAFVGGDAVAPDLLEEMRAAFPAARINVLYGPTEATIICATHRLGGQPAARQMAGRPLGNATLYVLLPGGDVAPVGAPGELCLGGRSVARDYLGRPALTAERFVPDPFSAVPGARLYRTGDRVRWLATGELEFLGRTDHQVKIRGFRIEPGEIEARLREHAGVREAVVLVREDAPGDRRLVAYVVADDPAGADVLRAHLLERLPEYMVPAAYVRLERLPLTPNGKVDRKALPAPEGDAYATRAYEAPVGETETALAEIWAGELGVDRVGRLDNFFELGGHSLLVVRVIARMRQRGLHAEVRALFAAPTLAALAAEVGGESPEVQVPANGIPVDCTRITPEMLPLVRLTQAQIGGIVAMVPGGAANVQDIYPLAPLQEGFLFHHLAAAEGDPYLLAALSSFDTRERLDAHLQAFGAVIARHDVLRTAVVWENVPEPVQVVWRKAPLPVQEVELHPDEDDVAGALYRRFDPRHHRIDIRRAPLVRGYVARDAKRGRWVFLLLQHHLAGDNTAMDVLRREIEAHLAGRAGALPAPLPFRNFVAQARLGVSTEQHQAFFREMLGDVTEPTAPFGLLDVRGDGSGIGEARMAVHPPLAARLRERARAVGVSPAALCHVAWAQVLARVSGTDDVVFGTVLFGRMQGGEGAERMMGPFINTLPVRIRVGGAGARASVLDTHALLAALLRHEHASLALAQRCSGVEAPAPLFTALLNYRHGRKTARPDATAAGTAAGASAKIYAEERSNYPLSLSVDDLGEAMALTAKVRAPVEARRVCALMHTALEGLVEALATEPERAVGSIEVLPAEERARLLEEWNRTEAEYPSHACVHQLFEAQAARTPDAVAVSYEGRTLTYAELNARANRLAHHLIGLGVGPDVRVGLCLERGMEMPVGLLAVLKAGGAYVPLDPDYPADRLRYMVEDSAPAALLACGVSEDSVDALVRGIDIPVIRLETDAAAWAHQPVTNPARTDIHPDHLVYVIYTSGSTGRPKGVMNHHRCLVNRLAWGARAWSITVDDVLLCKTSLSFDGHIREMFMPWSVGARVAMARPGGQRDPDYMLDVTRAEGVTTMNMNASMLLVLVENPALERCTSLRQLLVGGEALPGHGLTRLHERLPATALHITYGPSEAATAMTAMHCGPEQARATVPIGRATPNSRVYLLDPSGNPVPVGVTGELYIGGDSVCRGYLDRPALTAERFVPDPFGAQPGQRLYRTGDLGRWLPDGMMEFLGRNDFQVKVRGFRVELGEIEARLREHPRVRETVVMARADDAGEKRLIAWYTAEETVDVGELRAHLAERLPDYMVPAAFVRMETFPLTPSAKLDRKALPDPEGDAYGSREYEAPADETEEALAEIWAEVLRVERVGRGDDFFALGGHSLSAVRVISRVRQELGVEVALRELFTRPVLRDFSQEVLDAQLAQFDPEALAELLELAREPAFG